MKSNSPNDDYRVGTNPESDRNSILGGQYGSEATPLIIGLVYPDRKYEVTVNRISDCPITFSSGIELLKGLKRLFNTLNIVHIMARGMIREV